MSNFESKSWPELHAMVANAKPGDFHARAGKLRDAAQHMQDLSDELMTNMRTVEWEGESGDAFRSWTQQLATTTGDFATYTGNIADGLSTVGEHLGKTQSGIPKPPPTTITSTPFAGYQSALTSTANFLETPETNEAINLMTSLSSTYSTTAKDFGKAPPAFKPLPAAVVPSGGQWGESQVPISGGDSTSGTRAPVRQPEYGGYTAPPVGHETVTPSGGATIHVPHAPATPPGHTTLDSLPTLPTSTMPHAPTGPGSTPVDPTGGTPGLPIGIGGFPGGPPGSTGGWRPSQSYRQGGEPGLFGAGAADEGISGGMSSGRYGSVPGRSGMVVGGEGPSGTGGYGPRAASPGGASAAGEGAYTGTGPTRGAAGAAAGQEGTGGMRPGMGGMGGMGGHGSVGKGRGRAGNRPDYVVEDEETWMTGGGTVPPVID